LVDAAQYEADRAKARWDEEQKQQIDNKFEAQDDGLSASLQFVHRYGTPYGHPGCHKAGILSHYIRNYLDFPVGMDATVFSLF
jgi:hypothetical protein